VLYELGPVDADWVYEQAGAGPATAALLADLIASTARFTARSSFSSSNVNSASM
jgi:hypothetical protein